MVLWLGKELCFSYLNCNLLLINIKLHIIVRLLADVVAHLQPMRNRTLIHCFVIVVDRIHFNVAEGSSNYINYSTGGAENSSKRFH